MLARTTTEIVLAIALSAIASNSAHAYVCPSKSTPNRPLPEITVQSMPLLATGSEPLSGNGWCKDEACRVAAIDLFCTSAEMLSVLIPNTMGYITPAAAAAAWNESARLIATFPYAHPGRATHYCANLAQLAAAVPDRPRQPGDNTIRFTVELAVRLWPLDRTCPAKVKAALPDTPNIRAMFIEQNLDCLDRPAWCLPRMIPPVHLRPAQQRARRPTG